MKARMFLMAALTAALTTVQAQTSTVKVEYEIKMNGLVSIQDEDGKHMKPVYNREVQALETDY